MLSLVSFWEALVLALSSLSIEFVPVRSLVAKEVAGEGVVYHEPVLLISSLAISLQLSPFILAFNTKQKEGRTEERSLVMRFCVTIANWNQNVWLNHQQPKWCALSSGNKGINLHFYHCRPEFLDLSQRRFSLTTQYYHVLHSFKDHSSCCKFRLDCPSQFVDFDAF